MTRPTSRLKRAAAIAAGALLGISGAVALATPASAHHPIIFGSAPCVEEDGSWKVSWLVTNSETDIDGKVKKVEHSPGGSTFSGIAADDILPPGDAGLRGEQTLSEGQRKATLKVVVEWVRGGERRTTTYTQGAEAQVKRPKEVCETPEPTPTPTPTPTTEPSPEPTPTPTQTPTPTPTETPAEPSSPEGSVEFTCDEMIFGIINPEDGETVTATFTPNNGEPETLTVEPGFEGTIAFPAEEGLEVTVDSEDFDEPETIAWEQPEGCDTGGGGGGLPVTGAAAGGIAGGAALLLAVGGGLFFLARRRRVTFTA